MNDQLRIKYEALRENLRALGSVAVAFSSGADSTLLLWTAHDVLGDNAVAVTASSRTFPAREGREAAAFCRENGIAQIVFQSQELRLDSFRRNPADRCYICKRALFEKIRDIAATRGFQAVAEGSNVDDGGDYRPGLAAVRELGIRSPLREAGLTKEDVRALSRELGLPTWDKPSFACLASRFAYGEAISEETLDRVDRAEQLLLDMGFRQVRVRVHGNLARVEVLPDQLPLLTEEPGRSRVYGALRELGFLYVTADLGGYRTGSMNEPLFLEKKNNRPGPV